MKKFYVSLLAAGLVACTAADALATPQGIVTVADTGDQWPDQKPYGPNLTMTFVVTDNGTKAMTEGKIVCPVSMMSDYMTGAPERPIQGKIEKVYVVKSCSALGKSDVPVAEWTELNPGQELSFTDHEIEVGYDWNYTAFAVVNGNTSENWYGTHGVFTGFRPASPESVKGTGSEGHGPVTVSMVIPDRTRDDLSAGMVYKPGRVYVTRSYCPEGEWMYTDPVEVWSQENPETGVEISFVDTNNGEEMQPGKYTYAVSNTHLTLTTT